MTVAFPLPHPLPELVVGDPVTLELWRSEQVEEMTALIERSREDLAAFMPWASDPVTVEQEREVQAACEARWRAGEEVVWSVVESGRAHGTLGMHRRGGPDELEIGYWLAVESQGRGLMTMACAMATDVAFATEGIGAVEIVHDAANSRSEAIPRRLGYRRVSAHSSRPQARDEAGIKVRWRVERRDWLERAIQAGGVRAR